MAKITYNDKVALNVNADIPDENKFNASDMNEIKNVVNGLILGTKTQSDEETYSCNYINSINTYSTSEIDTGKTWIDGKHIYRKMIDTTVGNAETDLNALNCDFVINLSGWYKSNYDWTWAINSYPGSGNENYSLRIYRASSTGLFAVRYGSYVSTTYSIKIIIEYTKVN